MRRPIRRFRLQAVWLISGISQELESTYIGDMALVVGRIEIHAIPAPGRVSASVYTNRAILNQELTSGRNDLHGFRPCKALMEDLSCHCRHQELPSLH